MVRICPVCNKKYTDDSIFYCLDDGTALPGLASAPTLKIQTEILDEKALQWALSDFFEVPGVDELEFDSRFLRFLDWMKTNHPHEIYPLLIRIICRIHLFSPGEDLVMKFKTGVTSIEPGTGYKYLLEQNVIPSVKIIDGGEID